MTVWIIVGAAIVVAVLIALVVMRRRSGGADTVAEFRRHIDALGPRARRPTVDKVQELDDERRSAAKPPEDDNRGS